MRIHLEYETVNNYIVLSPVDYSDGEKDGLVRMIFDCCKTIIQHNDRIYIPYRAFLSLRGELAQFCKNHSVGLTYTDAVRQRLLKANDKSYGFALRAEPWTEERVQDALDAVGFTRRLTVNQMHNLCRLAPLPAGATFSVPGAGKTTEALAFFFCCAKPEDQLLVVGPLSAMGAWEDQLSECCPNTMLRFTRLRGGEKNVNSLLSANPKLMLISYGQFATVGRLIKDYLSYHSVLMFLDESHRIKSGRAGVAPQQILDVSYLPERKLILSGTPCPQSISDLIPQFEFLYPDHLVDDTTVVSDFQPLYVRTTKGQLDIPPVEHRKIQLDMSPLQREIYQTLRSETKRQMTELSAVGKFSLREIGKKIVKVMEFVSNPSLLAGDINYVFNEKLGRLLSEDIGPKIQYACQRARELAAEGHKVIIWSQFVSNVLLITERLRDLGADCIYGAVASGDENEEDTREWKIREFHTNPEKMVLVLNPAAASEAISLHRICHHAIYVDRSFNAAHYLQSEDRIHRLGLKPEEAPIVEILECRGTIDEVVDRRLGNKVRTMADALNDTSLNVDAIPYDTDFSTDEMDEDDIRAVLDFFFKDGLP